jgi:hypothetical protein
MSFDFPCVKHQKSKSNQIKGTLYNYLLHIGWTSKVVVSPRIDNLMFTSYEGINCFYSQMFMTWMFHWATRVLFVCLYNYEFWLSICNIVRSSVILLLPLFEKGWFMDEWLSQVESERIDNVSKYSIETDPQQHFTHWNLMRSCYEISFNQYLQINVFNSLNCSRSCCWYRKRQ